MPKPEEKHKIHEQLLPLKIGIDAYQPDPKNARKGHDIEGIAKSLDDYHQRTPIVVNTKTATILKGNGTWKAAKELGWTHIAAVVADDPKSVAVGYSIADNLLTDKSVFDVPMLNDILEGIDDPLDIPGVSADWLEGLGIGIDFNGDDEFGGSSDEIPENVDPVCKLGQLWMLGNHRLLCGDSTDLKNIGKVMGGNGWDVCVFDPPYEKIELYDFIPKNIEKKLLVFWDFKRFAIAPYKAIEKGWTPQYEFIWDCIQSWFTPNRPLQRHKACGYFCENPFFDTDKAIIKDGKDRGEKRTVKNTRGESEYTPLDGAVHIRTVEPFSNSSQNDENGYGKPSAWIEAIFNGIGGENVLDMFLGSGTSLIVCEKINKKCFGIELNPHDCDVIIKRWENFTGKKAKLI